jgi:hypothetical protein
MTDATPLQQWERELRQVRNNPTTSFWLSHAIGELLDRDPVDAADDAEILHRMMEARARALLSGDFHPCG